MPARRIDIRRRFPSTITQRGQVTLPAAIRRRLGVGPRDRVLFELQGDTVVVRAEPTLDDVFGAVPPLNPPRTLEEIDRIIEEEVVENVRQEMQEG